MPIYFNLGVTPIEKIGVGLFTPAFIAFCKAIKSSASIPHAKKNVFLRRNFTSRSALFS